jgi:non-specific serine/threonine protein kinase
LSVFAGGATPEAVEQVCVPEGSPGVAALDGLASLAGKSLVRPSERDGEPRFAMLETLREFAREKLAESGEEAVVRARHADYYRDLAKEMDARLVGDGQVEALDRLDADHGNLCAALAWDMGREDGLSDALRMSWSLRWFWHVRGHFGEERRWLEAALARAEDGKGGRSCVLQWAVRIYTQACDFTAALGIYEEQREAAREAGDRNWLAHVVTSIGQVEERRGNLAAAREGYREGLRLFTETGAERGVAHAHDRLGNLALKTEAWAEALRHFEACLAVHEASSDRRPLTDTQFGLARAANGGGDTEEARSRYREGLRLAGELGYRARIVEGLEGLAGLAADSRRFERACRLSGVASFLREGMEESPLHFLSPEESEITLRRVRASLGEDRFAAVWEEGRDMEPDAALAYALEDEGETGEEPDLSLPPFTLPDFVPNA